ncbi:uncharacterized protein LOC101862058 [Aplysia californica]|uniref:Uncharacterized protein LOC101862058 n=1 Tax=Aplysia californica TaxID=6500 RepID=A0ABM1A6K5_APLCA|nr:uncharacterized protein LOC101862058 [Aplysia californica]
MRQDVFTITPSTKAHGTQQVPPSPGGILKTPGKVSCNPNGKFRPGPQGAGMRRSVSVESTSTFDPSELERPGNLSSRQRCQRRLSVLLHTHVVLILVCTLAALDAVCVIGQLICDILIMREKLDHFEVIDDQLTDILFDHIPKLNQSLHPKWNLDAILDVLTGRDHHSNDGPVPTPAPLASNLSSLMSVVNSSVLQNFTHMNQSALHHRVRRAAKQEVPGHEVDHGLLYDLTHTFHLGSMVILSLLLLETLLKVFAMGKKLRHHKLEVFDAVVVAISWALDVAFWEGIWAHPGTTAATILIYMLPWRVVRIVNSFVLVIQEKDHVQLKIVKQRLRQSLKKSKEFTDKASSYRHEVKALAGLCRKLGANESEITACSPSGKACRRGSIHSVLERAASLTFISTLSSMGSLPSLFDMGEMSSDEEDSRPQHQDLDRTTSQAPTLKSAFSSTTLDSGSVVLSIDNDTGGGMEHPVFDDASNSSTKSSDVKHSADKGKREVERTSSSDSAPPSYHIAVSKTDSNTRL